MVSADKAHIIPKLQQEILALQGYRLPGIMESQIMLGPIQDAFPNRSFPLGAIHEFLFSNWEDGAATCGFITALLKPVMTNGGIIFWVGQKRTLFPPALESFGICPDKIVFVDVTNEKHVIWSVEEALKCPALSAVIGELHGISFTASRRLQLAVEQSEVTGFLLCNSPRPPAATACVSRWRITSLPGHVSENLPGVGFPQWRVELLRIRNGRPGVWDIRLSAGKFELAVLPGRETYEPYIEELTHNSSDRIIKKAV
jgi:protein ImuA